MSIVCAGRDKQFSLEDSACAGRYVALHRAAAVERRHERRRAGLHDDRPPLRREPDRGSSTSRRTARRSPRPGTPTTSSSAGSVDAYPVLPVYRTGRSPSSVPTGSVRLSPTVRRELAGIGLLLLALFFAGVLAAQGMADLRYGAGVTQQLRDRRDPARRAARRPRLVGRGAGSRCSPRCTRCGCSGGWRSAPTARGSSFSSGLALLAPIAAGLALHVGVAESRAAGLWGAVTSFYMVPLVRRGRRLDRRRDGRLRPHRGDARLEPDPRPAAPRGRPRDGRRLRRRVRRRRRRGARRAAGEAAPPEEGEAEAGDALGEALEPTARRDAGIRPLAARRRSRRRRRGRPAREGKRAKKKSKAEASAERDEEIAASIDAHATPAPGSDELPPTDLLTPAPARNVETSKRELDAMAREAHGSAAHLQRRRRDRSGGRRGRW